MNNTTSPYFTPIITPLVSFVVIGRNEGERLARCLRSIKNIKNPGCEIEIIYVDSASTDDSPNVATGLGARVVCLYSQQPTAALGRNHGWRVSHGKFVMFLDGDTILDPDFLKIAIRQFCNPKVAVVFGHRREIYPEKNIYNRVLDLDWISPVGAADYCGGDALIRRDVLEKVGGYDETLIAGEEPEMCRRIRAHGYRIEHIDQPMTMHDLAIRGFSQYWRRAVRTGYAYAEIAARFAATDSPLWSAEVKRNFSRTLVLAFILLAGIFASLFTFSFLPFAVCYFVFLFLCLRSAFKMRWKSKKFYTIFLYGIHSQFQHIPIFVGQIKYHLDRRASRKRALIEYKEV